MSRTVEENVVKMTFDNSEFDSNIKESQKTVSGMEGSLNNLKNTVLQLPAAMVNGLSNVLSKINLQDIIGVAGLIAGISLAKNAIIDVGSTITNVAAMAVSTVRNAMSTIIAQIQSGGRARAENIQQAKFLIEGLNLDVETFMEAAKYAVNDTAYGLDAAAKAAAQLGASGVTSLDKLKYSLRGISGVAAMTNSSYEEIAHIFTTVAGMGKVTNQYLDSIAIKGLNARQTLANELGKTEEEVRNMAANGQISFDMFAKAMDDAFGEHAKEANKTFSGVTANINAALSKIGEGFYTPLITDTLPFLDKVRALLNQIKSEMADYKIFDSFGMVVKNVSESLRQMFENISYALERSSLFEEIGTTVAFVFQTIDRAIRSVTDGNYSGKFIQIFNSIGIVLNNVRTIIQDFVSSFDEIFGLESIGHSFTSMLIKLFNLISETFNDKLKLGDFKGVFTSWFKALKQVWDAIKGILGLNFDNFSKVFKDIVGTAVELFNKLKLTDNEIYDIQRIASGVASAIDIIRMLVVEIFKFIKPAFGYIRPVIDAILNGGAAIGDWVTNLRNSIKEGEIFEKIFEKIGKGIEFIKDLFKNIKGNFFDIFFGEGSKDVSFFSKLTSFISQMFGTIGDALGKINLKKIDLSPLSTLFSSLSGFGNSGGESFIEKIGKIFTWIKDTLKKIADGISSIFKSDDTETIASASNENKGFLSTLKESISFVISETIRFLKGIVEAISGIDPKVLIAGGVILIVLINAIKDVLIALIEPLNGLTKVISKLMPVVAVVMVMLPALMAVIGVKDVLLKIINTFSPLSYISKLMETVNKFFMYHSKETAAKNRHHIDDFFNSLASFLYSIMVSLTVLSMIPVDDLERSIKSVMVLMLAITALTALLAIIAGSFENLTPKVKKLDSVSGNLSIGKIGKIIGSKGKSSLSNNGAYRQTSTFSESPLIAMATLIQALNVGLLAIAASLKMVSTINKEDVTSYLVQMGVMLAAVAGIAIGLTVFITKVQGIKATDMLVAAGSFALISFALIEMAAALGKMSEEIPSWKIKDAWGLVGMISVMAAVMGGILVGLTAISTLKDGLGVAGMIVAAMSITMMFAALDLILKSFTKVIKEAGKVEDLEKLQSVISVLTGCLVALEILAALIAVVGAVAAGINPITIAGMAVIALDIIAMAIPIVALSSWIAPAARAISDTANLLKSLMDLIFMARDLNDVEAANISGRIKVLISAIPKGIADGLADSKLAKELKTYLPGIKTLLTDTVIPFIEDLGKELIPKIGEGILTVLKGVNLYLSQASPAILSDLIEKADPIVANAVSALLVMLGSILDAINENIPMLTEKLFNIVMNIIETINKLLDDNKESILKNVTAIANFIVYVATLSILSDANLKAFYYAGSVVIGVLEQGMIKRLRGLLETMAEMADLAVFTFLAEIASAGLYDSSAIWQEFWDSHMGEITVDVDFDLSGAQDARKELEDTFMNMEYDTSGVYGSNSSNYRRQYQANVNRNDLKDSFDSWAGSIKDTIAQNAKTQIDLKFTSDTYGQLQLLNQEDNIIAAGGWN